MGLCAARGVQKEGTGHDPGTVGCRGAGCGVGGGVGGGASG